MLMSLIIKVIYNNFLNILGPNILNDRETSIDKNRNKLKYSRTNVLSGVILYSNILLFQTALK